MIPKSISKILDRCSCVDGFERDFIEDLYLAIEEIPCLVSKNGETTYECRVDKLCLNCSWRSGKIKELEEELNLKLDKLLKIRGNYE